MIKLALKAGLLWFITKVGREYMQSAGNQPKRTRKKRASRATR